MSMDNTGRDPSGDTTTGGDGSLFAPQPIWERRGKKRGFGGRARGASKSATTGAATAAGAGAAAGAGTAAGAGMTPETHPGPGMGHEVHHDGHMASTHSDLGGTTHTTPADTTYAAAGPTHDVGTGDEALVTPIARPRTRTTTTKRSGAGPAMAIGLGVMALGAVGLAGWYATQPDDGVAELTPGATTAAVSPTADLAAAGDTTAMASNTATASTQPAATRMAMAETTTTTPARAAARTERRTTVRTASRARPAAETAVAASATEVGIDASGTATLPDGPQPYSTLAPAASATTGGASATSSGTAATTTAPVTDTPAPIPSTPPVSANPGPATPPAPDTTTAPETTTEPTP